MGLNTVTVFVRKLLKAISGAAVPLYTPTDHARAAGFLYILASIWCFITLILPIETGVQRCLMWL